MWAAQEYRDEALPAVAADVLTRWAPYREVSASQVLQYVIETSTLPFQQNDRSRFGEPPVTVYWHPRFYIEALFWLAGSPTAHNHAFAGAFTLIEGQCLHTEFAFTCEETHPDEIAFGTMALTKSALYSAGTVETIEPGENFVHSVFHTGRPGLTLVVRTHSRSVGAGRQYLRPCLRVGPAFEDQLTRRQLQVLALLLQIQSPDYTTAAARIIDSSGMRMMFEVLQQASNLAPQSPQRTAVIAHARQRWGVSVDRIEQCLAFQGRQRFGMIGRRKLQSPDDLLLLGLLLQEECWSDLGKRLRQWRLGVTAGAWVADGLQRLATYGVWGIALDAETRQAMVTAGRAAVDGEADPAPARWTGLDVLLGCLYGNQSPSVRTASAR